MMDLIPILMFPALFLLIFAGLPVAFSLIIVAVIAALMVFGDLAFLQLYGAILSTSSNFILAAIPLFVFMGAVLERTGIALRLFQSLQLWGRWLARRFSHRHHLDVCHLCRCLRCGRGGRNCGRLNGDTRHAKVQI